MNMIQTESKQGRNIAVFKNQDFFCFSVLTGRGLLFSDPEIPKQHLPLDASKAILGEMVLTLLAKSKELSAEESIKTIRSGVIQKNLESWEKAVKTEFFYKNKKEIYLKMNKCSIQEISGQLKITPLCHGTLESWEGMKDVDNIILPTTSSFEEIASALYEAFDRCKNMLTI